MGRRQMKRWFLKWFPQRPRITCCCFGERTAALQAGPREPSWLLDLPAGSCGSVSKEAASAWQLRKYFIKIKSLPAWRSFWKLSKQQLGVQILLSPLWDAEVKVWSNASNLFSFLLEKVSSGVKRYWWLLQQTAKVKCQHSICSGWGSLYSLVALEGEQYWVKMAPGQKKRWAHLKLDSRSGSNKSFGEKAENILCVYLPFFFFLFA